MNNNIKYTVKFDFPDYKIDDYDFSEFAKELESRCGDCAGEGKLYTIINRHFIDGHNDRIEGYTVCEKCNGIGKKAKVD